MKNRAELIQKMPDLMTKTEIDGKGLDEGEYFGMMCELMKANATPTEKWDLSCLMIIILTEENRERQRERERQRDGSIKRR